MKKLIAMLLVLTMVLPFAACAKKDAGMSHADYVAAANNLANMFSENFAKKYPNMPKNIAEAGPKAK